MSAKDEDELVYGYADCGSWGHDEGMEKDAWKLLNRIKAEVWEECEDSAYFDPETRHQVSHGKNPYREEL